MRYCQSMQYMYNLCSGSKGYLEWGKTILWKRTEFYKTYERQKPADFSNLVNSEHMNHTETHWKIAEMLKILTC